MEYAPNNYEALVLKSLNSKAVDKDEEAFGLLVAAYNLCPKNQDIQHLLHKFCESSERKMP